VTASADMIPRSSISSSIRSINASFPHQPDLDWRPA
jgi:hypothetical protein